MELEQQLRARMATDMAPVPAGPVVFAMPETSFADNTSCLTTFRGSGIVVFTSSNVAAFGDFPVSRLG